MITALMTLYLQWISIVGLLEESSTNDWYSSGPSAIVKTTPYFDTELGISSIEWYKNPYFQCPKCKSGQVQAMMTPLGCSKEFVFDCHCEACEGKWQVKIPVIVEVIE